MAGRFKQHSAKSRQNSDNPPDEVWASPLTIAPIRKRRSVNPKETLADNCSMDSCAGSQLRRIQSRIRWQSRSTLASLSPISSRVVASNSTWTSGRFRSAGVVARVEICKGRTNPEEAEKGRANRLNAPHERNANGCTWEARKESTLETNSGLRWIPVNERISMAVAGSKWSTRKRAQWFTTRSILRRAAAAYTDLTWLAGTSILCVTNRKPSSLAQCGHNAEKFITFQCTRSWPNVRANPFQILRWVCRWLCSLRCTFRLHPSRTAQTGRGCNRPESPDGPESPTCPPNRRAAADEGKK